MLRFCSIALTLFAGVVSLTVLQAAQTSTSQAPAARGAAPAVNLPAGSVERGRYIAERVAMCVECHSGRDSQGNILEAQRYQGAQVPVPPPAWSRNWATHAPRNKGLPGYSDAAALRLLTQGSIGRNGNQLRPPMPQFRMTTQDAADVIAFLRSGQ